MIRDWFLVVVLAWAAIFVIVLGRSSSAQDKPCTAGYYGCMEYDYLGFMYPKQCRRNLSDIFLIIDYTMPLGYGPGNEKRTGQWKPGRGWVDRSIKEWADYARIVHHLKCHEVIFRETGQMSWHPGFD